MRRLRVQYVLEEEFAVILYSEIFFIVLYTDYGTISISLKFRKFDKMKTFELFRYIFLRMHKILRNSLFSPTSNYSSYRWLPSAAAPSASIGDSIV